MFGKTLVKNAFSVMGNVRQYYRETGTSFLGYSITRSVGFVLDTLRCKRLGGRLALVSESHYGIAVKKTDTLPKVQ